MKYVPKAFHKLAIKFGLERARCAIWADPGMGKTGISYAIIKVRKKLKLLKKPVLVVAPLPVVYHVWPKERSKWDDFQQLTLKILHGPKKSQRLREPADVYLINYEGLMWLARELNERGLTDMFGMLIIDEASKMKSPKAQRFRLMKAGLIKRFEFVLELTGTPAANGLEDVWAQIFLLDYGAALGRYVTWFRDQYFNSVGYGGFTLVPKRGAPDQIYDAISHLVLRMDAKDWLDLPDLIKLRVVVDVPPEAWPAYKQLEDQLVLKIRERSITIANAGAAVGKCLQYASGAVYDDSGVSWERVHDAKLDALDDLIDELGGKPLLVGYWYDHDRERIVERFKAKRYGLRVIGRGTKPKEVGEIIEAWNHGGVKLLAAQVGKVAYGLNLQEGPATNIAFFSMFWDLELYIQFIDRMHREGQKGRIVVHHIVADKTVDLDVIKTLKGKDVTQTALLDAIKERNELESCVQ